MNHIQKTIMLQAGYNPRSVSREDAIAAFGGGVVGERAPCFGGGFAVTGERPTSDNRVMTHGKRKPKVSGVCRRVHSRAEDRRKRKDARTGKAKRYTGLLAEIAALGGLES